MTFSSDAYAAVCDLHARYSVSLDRRELQALTDCFADDAVLRVGGTEAATGGRTIATRLKDRAPAGIVHTVSTTTVWADGASLDRWSSCAYFQLYDSDSGELAGLGSYDDVVRWDGVANAHYIARDVNYLWRPTRGS